MTRVLNKVMEFIVNKDYIPLLLYCIENEYNYNKLLNKPDFLEDDIQLLDMAGIINYDYTLNKYFLGRKVVNAPTKIRESLEEYRKIFSIGEEGVKGLKPGSMGDAKSIVKKLNKWFKDYPNYSMEDVINTTKFYADDLKKRGDIKYLMKAHFFIEKNGDSTLSSLIEEGKNYSRLVNNSIVDELI